jgi:mannosidase alpha-like ER degradation enhancer 1
VQIRSLRPASTSVIDSLSAFFPGVQVLAGDIESAIRNHLVFWNIWRRYSGIPESWAHDERVVGWAGWPGRPEFIESTYYLYTVTRDDFYLRVGERVLRDIRRRTITPCGFATLSNVETGETEDRMESFLLSETLKYLYLLFADLPSKPPSNTVFTTEGHQLHLPRNLTRGPTAIRRALHKHEDLYCPAYVPQTLGGLPVGIEGRDDYEYARALVYGPGKDGLRVEEGRTYDGLGTCHVPEVPRFAFELVLTPSNADPDAPLPAHDASPSSTKVWQKEDGDWVITDIGGLRLGCRWRFDGGGYDITNIGPHRVRYGQHVYITDPKMEGYLPTLPPETPKEDAQDVVLLVRHAGKVDTVIRLQTSTADFGRAFLPSPEAESEAEAQQPFSADEADVPLAAPLLLVVPKNTLNGCAAVQPKRLDPKPKGPFALFVARGGCSFAEKAVNAVRAGASMLLIGDNEAGRKHVRPTASDEADSLLAEVAGLRVGFIGHDEAMVLATLHNAAPLEVALEGPLAQREGSAVPKPTRREGRLVVGDHDLVNIRVVEA